MHVFVQSQNNILKTLFISHTQEGQRTGGKFETGVRIC